MADRLPNSRFADLPFQRMFGILVVHQLNTISRDDPEEPGTPGGCCERCCAPCADVLLPLLDAEALDFFVRQAPEELWGPGTSWWVGDRDTGHVDGRWLRELWRCQSRPQCDSLDDEPEPQAPERKPCPEGFHWIGQPFTSCDWCGLPAWDHAGQAVPALDGGPWIPNSWKLEPWKADAIRAKWEPKKDV